MMIEIKRSARGWISASIVTLVMTVAMLVFIVGEVSAVSLPSQYLETPPTLHKPAVAPNQQLRVHRVSNVHFSITNKGIFGSQGRDEYDSLTGEPAPSCEFPAGSNIEYLFQGALWIGGVVERANMPGVFDTLVSIGNDGWWGDIFEMYAATPPAGNILMLSTRGPNSPPYADSIGRVPELAGREFRAVSEQDFIAVYYDTNTSTPNNDPNDGRPHRPLGLRIVQKSYSWSYEYAEDFILIDFEITNISPKALRDIWIGLYIDADVYHISEDPYGGEEGAQDDICGYMEKYVARRGTLIETTEINTAWIADNNGQPYGNAYTLLSPKGVSGCRVVRQPKRDINYGFNWWISNINSQYDWGPMQRTNYEKLSRLFGSAVFPGGGLGTPGGDRAKYFVMSAGEFDYDQIYCALDWQSRGWIANRAENPGDLANGYDTRYLFSFGPFDSIPSGATLPLTIAYICGDNFHTDPLNYETNLRTFTGDSVRINRYYSKLNFRDFATNAQWAEWVYDNPGRDSCWVIDENGVGSWVVDGNRGEFRLRYPGGDTTQAPDTFWYKGDGCPDFQGPPPPPSPRLSITVDKGVVELRWTSKDPTGFSTSPESYIDPFSGQKDFEGYNIYRSYDALNWTLLAHYDKIDWVPVDYDSTRQDSLSPWNYFWNVNKDKMYPISTDSVLKLDSTAYFNQRPDPSVKTRYWLSHDLNLGLDALVEDTEFVGTDTIYHYLYRMEGLSESRGTYFAVTAFDYGDPQTDLSPLESAKSINANLIFPIRKTDPIMVYPNPYRIDRTQYYIDAGYEDPERKGWAEQSRRIWFSNLPDDQWAIIRIWTLDGDLVRTLTYDPRDYMGNAPGIVYWDLISRNTQAVVSGMYLYSVEFHSIVPGVPDKEPEIGKFVIIK